MKRNLFLSSVLLWACTGCLFTPRCEQARVKEAAVPNASYQKVYEATEAVLEKYFEILYADPKSGVITTRHSQSKSPEQGIVKLRAIAVITPCAGKGTPRIHLKVIMERFREMWDIWGHNIIEEDEFLGIDKIMVGRLLNEIEQRLMATQAAPAAPAPTPAPLAPPTPPPTGIAPPPPSSAVTPPPPAPVQPEPGKGALEMPPAVVAFPPPPEQETPKK